ncbi:MAG: hypothetical protein AAF938_06975 [Myxococcota bacterium]
MAMTDVLRRYGARASEHGLAPMDALLAQAAKHALVPLACPRPEEGALARAEGSAGDEALVRALLAREHTARFDHEAADSLLGAASQEASGPGAEAVEVERRLIAAMRGVPTSDARPASSYDASFRIDAVSAHALGLLPLNPDDALRFARRASRMARTEALQPSECLANLVLARVRRVRGRPHIAAHILQSLSRFAPKRWRGWIAWEWLLCGCIHDARSLLLSADGAAADAASVLAEGLRAAARGERQRFDLACRGLSQRLGAFASTDLTPLRASMWTSEARNSFVDCTTHALPPRIAGLGSLADLDQERVESHREPALLVVRPGHASRRVFRTAFPIARSREPELAMLPTIANAARLDTAISVLAGAAAVERAEAFEAIYRFRFVPEAHAGTFRALLHRVRKRLEGFAEVRRVGSHLSLHVHAPFAVADPRTAPDAGVHILARLSSRRASAKELASSLRLPLRTVQTTLGELVESGECVRQRSGNQVQYMLEDTTFSEPTDVRAADASQPGALR